MMRTEQTGTPTLDERTRGVEGTPLTICHVLWSVELGGAERVVLDLARVQRAGGHRVAVVTLSDTEGAMASEFRRVVDTLEAVKKGRRTDPILPIRLARWFRKHDVQIVHTHNELPLIYAAPGAKLARTPVVHTKHGVVGVKSRAHRLRQLAARTVDRFVSVSEATADTARQLGECAPSKLRTIINGTNLSRFPGKAGSRERIREELGIPATARTVIAVGRLVKEKNHALLLRAIAPLLANDVRLLIVGDGPLGDTIRRTVSEMANGRAFIHMLGSRRDIPELLAASDAWVLASSSEGLPIAVLEAWAARVPVIATAVGGIPAALEDGKTGLLVPSEDEHALRAALSRVLQRDREIEEMAERGQRHVLATYSAETMAERYERLYREVVPRRSE